MKRIYNVLPVKTLKVTGIVIGLLASKLSFASSFVLPSYETYSLDNGLTVYLMQQDEVPLIDIQVVVKAGSAMDEISGTANLTAESLLLGTPSLSREAFEQQLEFVGAEVSTDTGSEYSRFSLSLASKDLDALLPVVFEAVVTPTIPAEEFSRHQKRYLAGLEQQKESPRAVIGTYFNALMYQGHPYANPVEGTSASVATLSAETVKSFHKHWYQPGNSALIISGDIQAASLKSKIKDLFGKWQGKAESASLPAKLPKPDQATVLLVNKNDARESTFMIGGPGIAFSNPDYVAVSVINTVLGGRFTSWLNDELRVNSGLTYGARSRFTTRSLGGSFYISTFTQTATTTDAIDLALKTYQRLWQQGIDQETLESAKAYVKGQFPPRYETASQLANLMSDMFVYGFDENFINTFTEQVSRLDSKRAKAIIEQYFPRENLQFVIVGKADDIREQVKKYGELRELEITAESIKL